MNVTATTPRPSIGARLHFYDMELAVSAIKSALSKAALKPKAPAPPRAPSAFLLFGKAQRAAAPAGTKVSFTEIGQAWKALPEAQKAVYQAQASEAKAKLPAFVAPSDEPELEMPMTLKIKDDAALNTLAKKIAEEALKDFMKDLVSRADAGEGFPEKVTKVGSFVAKLDLTSKKAAKPVLIEFAPSPTLRKTDE